MVPEGSPAQAVLRAVAAAAAAAMASAAWRAAAAAACAVLLRAAEGLAPGGAEDSSGSEEVERGCPHPPSVQDALEAGGAASLTAPRQVAPAQRGGANPMASARSVAQAPHPRPSRPVGALLEPALVARKPPPSAKTRAAPLRLRHGGEAKCGLPRSASGLACGGTPVEMRACCLCSQDRAPRVMESQ